MLLVLRGGHKLPYEEFRFKCDVEALRLFNLVFPTYLSLRLRKNKR